MRYIISKHQCHCNSQGFTNGPWYGLTVGGWADGRLHFLLDCRRWGLVRAGAGRVADLGAAWKDVSAEAKLGALCPRLCCPAGGHLTMHLLLVRACRMRLAFLALVAAAMNDCLLAFDAGCALALA